ncbi:MULTISPECIES: hypothetical protein [unclassified Mesorhizobium]|uniref:hypothetical protein n=1 Tax=unclassified Mesorhizobium TaxID=325217 RepID=UPI0020C9E5AD|nr:hypothetical protein [Mesorhizobium sp. LMG 17147]MCP9231115.1 hypothetical protein [Mesorhizobium sp. LMG 17147]
MMVIGGDLPPTPLAHEENNYSGVTEVVSRSPKVTKLIQRKPDNHAMGTADRGNDGQLKRTWGGAEQLKSLTATGKGNR